MNTRPSLFMALLVACAVVPGSVLAADPSGGNAAFNGMGPLSPDQLRAIHAISRDVVVAHNSQADANGDRHQFDELRTAINALILTETREEQIATHAPPRQNADPSSPVIHGAMSGEMARTGATPAQRSARLQGVRAKAREWAGRLRSRAQSVPPIREEDARNPREALQARRARLLKTWGDELERVTDDAQPDRIARLTQLRDLLTLSNIAPSEQGYRNPTPTISLARPQDAAAPRDQ